MTDSNTPMSIKDINLATMLHFDVETGRVLLGSDRMLLFRQDSLGVLRKLLFEQMGSELAKGLLSQFGHQCGYGDYGTLSKMYDWASEQDQFAAGPVLHTWEGIVHVTPVHLEYDRGTGHFHMKGVWKNSYEAEIHLENERTRSPHPVCHTLTGYASGWSSAFFGRPLLAIETACIACGDPHCEFEIKPFDEWGSQADPWRKALQVTSFSLAKELETKLALIEDQAAAISEMSTPIMEVWDDILVLPIVGVVDTKRSLDIMNNLLGTIVARQAKFVIIDVTGVEVVDTMTADYLLKVVRAARLLGTRCVLTGLSPAVAQTLVEIGADLTEVTTLRNLKEGLKSCLRQLQAENAKFST